MLNKFYKLKSIDGAKKLTQTVKNSKYTTKNNEEIGRIHVSLLTSSDKKIDENSYAYELAEMSGGIVYSGASQVKAEPMVMRLALTGDTTKTEQTKETNNNLIKILGQGNEGKYTVITSTGLIDSVKLKTVLNDSNKTDTDLDGLIDWNEVNVDIINNHLKNEGKQELKTVRNSDLPLFSDLILNSAEWGSFKPYLWTETDFARYAYSNCFDNVRILPIVSDPSKADSDGIVDCMKYFDSDAYQHNVNKEKYKITEFNDPNPLKFEYLWEWPVISSDNIKLNRMQSSFIEPRKNGFHKAIDFTPNDDKKYYAISSVDGIVTFINNNCPHFSNECSCGGRWGNYIAVETFINGTAYTFLYAHLEQNSIRFKLGDHVNMGDIIAEVGSSGGSSGRHLDFSIRTGSTNSGIGQICYDPLLFNAVYVKNEYKPISGLNILINVPVNLECTCNGSCRNICLEYFNRIKEKYEI